MKKAFGIVSTVLILAILCYIVYKINFFEVYQLIVSANLLFFIFAILAYVLGLIIWNLRLCYLMKPILKKDFWFSMHTLLAGAFFNTVTPGAGIGGEPFRAHFISKKYKKPRSISLGYVLGDRFFQLGVQIFFVIFSVLFVFFYVRISPDLRLLFQGALFFILFVLIVFIYLKFGKSKTSLGQKLKKLYLIPYIKNRFRTPEHFSKYLNSRVKNLSKIFKKVVKNRKNVRVGIFLSLVYWLLRFLVVYFLFLSFGRNINFLSVIIVTTLGEVIGSLSSLPGGLAVTETAMILLFSAMGVPTSLALLIAILNRAISAFFSLFLGGASLIYIRRVTEENGRIF